MQFKLRTEQLEIEKKLNDPNTKVQVSYAEYEELKKKEKELETAINKLRIEQNIWDQAREICMNIADEMLN